MPHPIQPKGDEHQPSVATIVVTYNSSATITRCLQALEASSVRSHVYVVDNASSDDTTSLVAVALPEATVISSPRNVGFPEGCNLGMARAREDGHDLYFFVNPDAYVEPDCLSQLVVAMHDAPKAAASSPLIMRAGTDVIWYAGAALDVGLGRYEHRGWGDTDHHQYTGIEETGRPTGCVMLVRGAVVDEVGPMDASYFLYWEETEWTLRFREAGYVVLFVPSARAEHAVSSATGGVGATTYEYYFARNRLRLERDHSERSTLRLVPGQAVRSARRALEVAAGSGFRAAAGSALASARGIFDFVRGRSGPRAGV